MWNDVGVNEFAGIFFIIGVGFLLKNFIAAFPPFWMTFTACAEVVLGSNNTPNDNRTQKPNAIFFIYLFLSFLCF